MARIDLERVESGRQTLWKGPEPLAYDVTQAMGCIRRDDERPQAPPRRQSGRRRRGRRLAHTALA
jgi:hypothetical protein